MELCTRSKAVDRNGCPPLHLFIRSVGRSLRAETHTLEKTPPRIPAEKRFSEHWHCDERTTVDNDQLLVVLVEFRRQHES